MKIVIATDSFKGTLTAAEACSAIARGILKVFPRTAVVTVPMADGGEGTAEAITRARNGRFKTIKVNNPLGKEIKAFYGLIDEDRTAVIEMAQASGLLLIPPDKRNILKASTFGTGQMIVDAVNQGANQLLVTVGGSGTNDCGCGMAQAFGYRFYTKDGHLLPPTSGGGEIGRVAVIDKSMVNSGVLKADIKILCDVQNPLVGPSGASRVYAPQKGATFSQVETLEKNITSFGTLLEKTFSMQLLNTPGAGAAGGMGAGLMAFTGGQLYSGIDQVIDATRLAQHCENADAIITGEGCLDEQSFCGKTVSGISRLARTIKLPLYAIAGRINVTQNKIDEYFTAAAPISESTAGIGSTDEQLAACAERCALQWFSV